MHTILPEQSTTPEMNDAWTGFKRLQDHLQTEDPDGWTPTLVDSASAFISGWKLSGVRGWEILTLAEADYSTEHEQEAFIAGWAAAMGLTNRS